MAVDVPWFSDAIASNAEPAPSEASCTPVPISPTSWANVSPPAARPSGWSASALKPGHSEMAMITASSTRHAFPAFPAVARRALWALLPFLPCVFMRSPLLTHVNKDPKTGIECQNSLYQSDCTLIGHFSGVYRACSKRHSIYWSPSRLSAKYGTSSAFKGLPDLLHQTQER